MNQNFVWGGEPEIQALSEIYRRPIEIYRNGALPVHIRGCEFDYIPSRPPLKLHYRHFHYNSVSSSAQQAFLKDETEAGNVETIAIDSSKILRNRKCGTFFKNSGLVSQDMDLIKTLEESRKMKELRLKARSSIYMKEQK